VRRVCQGSYGLFTLLAVAWLAATGVSGERLPEEPVGEGIPVHLLAWRPTPFAQVTLASPDLAACFLLSPGWWATAAAGQVSADPAELGRALAAQLHGVGGPETFSPLTVYLASSERNSTVAVVHGDTALVLAPGGERVATPELARALAAARLLAAMRPAATDPRCNEVLLAFGEAIANAGSLELAELPPSLRPVKAWLEMDDVDAALDALADQSLDATAPWQERQARLATLSQLGGAGQRLATAAALVVEAFGDAARARRTPFDLLLAWRHRARKEFPAIPLALRRAVNDPLEAGMPRKKGAEERAAIAASALARRVAAGGASLSDVPSDAPAALRLQVAGGVRRKGVSGLCAWLTAGPLPAVRTGCQGPGEGEGIVLARPHAGAGFDIVWHGSAGEEAVLLVWPRWLLFPAVIASTGDLVFIDAEGVWNLPLDGHAAPRLIATGSFRHLAVSPDGATLALARWPDGNVVMLHGESSLHPAVDGRAGLAWIEPDLLLTADGKELSLASLSGDVRTIMTFPCCTSLVWAKDRVVAGTGDPCGSSLTGVALAERRATPLVKLAEPPLGLVFNPPADVVFGAAEGVWRWRGQGAPERIGAGVTPGPG
jgi:hypothetical protein